MIQISLTFHYSFIGGSMHWQIVTLSQIDGSSFLPQIQNSGRASALPTQAKEVVAPQWRVTGRGRF
jgi:hypothetical protein